MYDGCVVGEVAAESEGRGEEDRRGRQKKKFENDFK